MKMGGTLHFSLLLTIILSTAAAATAGGLGGNEEELIDKQHYIVYMGDLPSFAEASTVAIDMHFDVLSTAVGGMDTAKDVIVHNYAKSFSAFVAKLSQVEAQSIKDAKGVLTVFPNKYHKLDTTRSWDFIGFPQDAQRNLQEESNVIVGVMDTGIEPTSESFNDKGFGPPPAKWKGRCGPYTNFSGCNNKLIGAKYFNLEGAPVPGDVLSPTDVQGHGTHTASTVAGAAVPGANLYSLASGTARGAVPSARVAAYKVCWLGLGCSDMDLLAAFDAAIADGVDVISVSIGGSSSDFFTDTISIGAFHAMKRGIMTVCSAGNSGPSAGTVQNYAPWIFTVAASATDRQFRSQISLGNGMKLTGIGINTFTPAKTAYPLVTGDEIAKPDASLAEFCSGDALDPEKAKGKIVYCKALEPGVSESIQMVGGEGFILETTQYLDTAAAYSLPGTVVSPRQGKIIAEYLNSTRNATVEISKSVAANIKAPFVATFSSRGPGPSSLRFIKPDIAAPGVDILAAYSTLTSMTGTSGDTRVVKFMMMSGTSMACPHVSGVAAYVKSFHPTWSPAMIKSAIMTTATPMSSQNDKEAEMAYGSGQLNPVKALNPGLVYDTDEHGYMSFLCSQGYMESNSLKIITGNKSINCADFPKAMGFDDLNYPSMFMTVPPADNKTSQPQPTTAIFVRKLTNVGPPQSEYSAKVECPPDVSVTVQPPHFSFNHTHQKFSFMVIVKAKPSFNDYIRSAALIWSDSVRTVRSPIVIM